VSLIVLPLLAERPLSLSGQPRYTVELTLPILSGGNRAVVPAPHEPCLCQGDDPLAIGAQRSVARGRVTSGLSRVTVGWSGEVT